jgi:hypothetical protein
MESILSNDQLKGLVKKLQSDEQLKVLYEKLRSAYRHAEVVNYAYDHNHLLCPVFQECDQQRINDAREELEKYRDRMYGKEAVDLGF